MRVKAIQSGPSAKQGRVASEVGACGGMADGGDGEKYPLKFPPPCVWRPVPFSIIKRLFAVYLYQWLSTRVGTFETFTPEASAQACRKACGRASWQGSRAHCNLLIVAFCPETAPAWHPATLGLAIVLPVLAERRHVASKGR